MKYDYDNVDELLSHLSSNLLAEEIHGLACGTLVSGQSKATLWLKEILPEVTTNSTLANNAQKELLSFYEHIKDELDDEEMPFTLLLPDDIAPLTERVEALIEWSRGFNYGIILIQLDNKTLSDNSQEMLDDIINFTTGQIDCSENEENEQAYQEIIEYIRVGVVFIYEETTQNIKTNISHTTT